MQEQIFEVGALEKMFTQYVFTAIHGEIHPAKKITRQETRN